MTHILSVLLTPVLFLFQVGLTRVKEKLERFEQKANDAAQATRKRRVYLHRHVEGLSFSAKGAITGLEPLRIHFRLNLIGTYLIHIRHLTAYVRRRYEYLISIAVIVLGPWVLTSACVLAWRWGRGEICTQQGVLIALPVPVLTLGFYFLFLWLVTSLIDKLRRLLNQEVETQLDHIEERLHTYLWQV